MTAETVTEPKAEKPSRNGDERSQIVQWLFGKDSTTVTLFLAIGLIAYDKGVIQPTRDIAIEERHTKQMETVSEKFDRDQERDNEWLKSLMFNRPAQGQLQGQTQSQSFKFGYDHGELVREQIAKNREQDDATVHAAGMRRDRGGHHSDAGGGGGGPGASGGGQLGADDALHAVEQLPVWGSDGDAVAGTAREGEGETAEADEAVQAPR